LAFSDKYFVSFVSLFICLCQNEWSVCLLQEYSDPDQVSLETDLLDLEEDDSNCRHGDNHDDPIHQQNEVNATFQHYAAVQA